MKWHVIYIDAIGNLARAEFSNAEIARLYADENTQSCVIHGDHTYLDQVREARAKLHVTPDGAVFAD
jgi:hypothetical protein